MLTHVQDAAAGYMSYDDQRAAAGVVFPLNVGWPGCDALIMRAAAVVLSHVLRGQMLGTLAFGTAGNCGKGWVGSSSMAIWTAPFCKEASQLGRHS